MHGNVYDEISPDYSCSFSAQEYESWNITFMWRYRCNDFAVSAITRFLRSLTRLQISTSTMGVLIEWQLFGHLLHCKCGNWIYLWIHTLRYTWLHFSYQTNFQIKYVEFSCYSLKLEYNFLQEKLALRAEYIFSQEIKHLIGN